MVQSGERKHLTITLPIKTIERIRIVRRDTGIPISQIMERSFLKSEYNDPKQN